jgi:hypothetical protein
MRNIFSTALKAARLTSKAEYAKYLGRGGEIIRGLDRT